MTTMSPEAEQERIRRIHWCQCGQPWIPGAGFPGDETECPACILRRLLVEEQEKNARARGPSVAKAKPDGQWLPYTKAVHAFLWVIDECQRYAEAHPEHAEAAQQIAVRVWQEAKRD